MYGDTTTMQTTPQPLCTIDPLGGGTADCHVWQALSLSMTDRKRFTQVNALGDGVNAAVLPFSGALESVSATQAVTPAR